MYSFYFISPSTSIWFAKSICWHATGTWKLFTTQKKSQNWRRAINSTPFSDFLGGVWGQKCICSDRFWEKNKNDPQRRCNFLHLMLNLEMTFQGIFHQKLVFAQHQITAVSNHFGTFHTSMKVWIWTRCTYVDIWPAAQVSKTFLKASPKWHDQIQVTFVEKFLFPSSCRNLFFFETRRRICRTLAPAMPPSSHRIRNHLLSQFSLSRMFAHIIKYSPEYNHIGPYFPQKRWHNPFSCGIISLRCVSPNNITTTHGVFVCFSKKNF